MWKLNRFPVAFSPEPGMRNFAILLAVIELVSLGRHFLLGHTWQEVMPPVFFSTKPPAAGGGAASTATAPTSADLSTLQICLALSAFMHVVFACRPTNAKISEFTLIWQVWITLLFVVRWTQRFFVPLLTALAGSKSNILRHLFFQDVSSSSSSSPSSLFSDTLSSWKSIGWLALVLFTFYAFVVHWFHCEEDFEDAYFMRDRVRAASLESVSSASSSSSVASSSVAAPKPKAKKGRAASAKKKR